ncbi:MAG: peptidoglycan DD-metalloendopeptidase family protein [bacterium]
MDFQPNTKITKAFRLSLRRSIFLFVPIISLFLIPSVTHAGVLSFLSDFFSGQKASAESETFIGESSQNMPVLETANNSDLSVAPYSSLAIDGGEALLPEVGPSTVAPEKVDNSNGQISTYVVHKGDTFAGIAKMFGVSTNTVLWANDLNKNSILKEGQVLVILPISGVIHDVVKGDTLSSIAKKYGGDVGEIAQFNDMIVTDGLVIGEQIIIPDGEVSSSITTNKKTTTVYNVPNYNSYYAQPFSNGPRIHQTQGLHGYRNSSVDYGMPVGTPLSAAAGGTVIISRNSGWNGGYGNYVIIQHSNNTQTIYAHMSSTIVRVGQTVSQGQLIGYSGNSGNSTGPHLHLEVRGAKNPFNFM